MLVHTNFTVWLCKWTIPASRMANFNTYFHSWIAPTAQIVFLTLVKHTVLITINSIDRIFCSIYLHFIQNKKENSTTCCSFMKAKLAITLLTYGIRIR